MLSSPLHLVTRWVLEILRFSDTMTVYTKELSTVKV